MNVAGHLQGIDVSHYQGQVDWSAVAAAGIAFAFAKATDGITYTDPDFQANWQGMRAAGLARGAYHFYETGDDPVAQAGHFVATVGALDAGDLPPVVDIESSNGDYEGRGVAANLQVWLNAVEQALGRTPMIYTNLSFWNNDVSADFGRYPLWIAEYGVAAPTLPTGWNAWTFWQYSQQGSVGGVAGEVDQDVYAGTSVAQLVEWSRSRFQP